MTRLHVFDMDGTLLRGAATVELSRHLGAFEIADAVERSWNAGGLTDLQFWESVLPLWEDASEAEIDAAFEAAAWIEGVPEVFADIRARGEHVAVISQSPHFFVRRLEGWGAHRTFGSDVVPGRAPRTDSLLTLQHKVDITLSLLADLGLGEDDCTAYGDSRSDMLLFERLTHTVGVNPTELLRDRCAVVYEGSDLRAAYALGRELVPS
ncbi:HAD-IB family phosphatase [Pseudonocardia sp. NPDC049635]|uniref:HAD family hydrolase n=1 Tax=Pseudonocardia sp. NPDC049635 TaxID=3155506 RepID=UPI0033F375F0